MIALPFLPLSMAFVVMILLGYLATDLFCPWPSYRPLAWAIAPGIGAGICSLIFFTFRRPMFTIEGALLIVLIGAWLFRRANRLDTQSLLVSRKTVTLWVVFFIALGSALPGVMLRIDRSPHGEWDAFAIWNSHARFLYRDGPHWAEQIQGKFQTTENTFHPDYPLLLPSVTARFWRYADQDVPEAGALLGVMFAISGIAVLVVTLAMLRDTSIAVLFGLVLVGTPFYLTYATTQFADLPLSFFILSTLALICLYFEGDMPQPGLLVLAGFTAGCAGWTKNEGLVLIVATCGALLLPVFRKPSATLRRFMYFSAGLLLPLAVIAFYKLMIAHAGWLTANRSADELIAKFFTWNRYVMIATTMARSFWSFGKWTISPLLLVIGFVVLRGTNRMALLSPALLTSVAVLLVVIAGYFSTYLATPMDLRWHLDSSIERLWLQLCPSFLLVCGLLGPRYSRPEHAEANGVPRG